MKHLITGGSGFLGNLIMERLMAKGEEVKILDIWKPKDLSNDVEFIKCDILDRQGVAKAMKGIDIVHHNVALVPLTKSGARFWEVNVNGSQIAAEEALKAGVNAFIHMSSSALYGAVENFPITNSTKVKPIEIYGKAKLAGEQIVSETLFKSSLPLIIIRPRTILGQGRLGIFQILFDWIRDNKNVYVIGSGNVKFQFIHAFDLMDAYMLAYEKGISGTYNVGCTEFGTLRQSLENIIIHAKSSSKVKSLPEKLTIGTLKIADWMGVSPLAPWHYLTYHKEFYFDTQKLTSMGWDCKYSNDEMFAESYDWFCDNYENMESRDSKVSAHRRPVKESLLKLVKLLS